MEFFITLKHVQNLNSNKHVVFANIIQGINIIRKIERMEVDENDVPIKNICISGFGAVGEDWDTKVSEIPDYPDDHPSLIDSNPIPREMFDISKSIKLSGTLLFKNNDYSNALEKYQTSIRYLVWYFHLFHLGCLE